MTNVPLGPGGWHYGLGHRVCVTGLGKATKTQLQGAFGEFGHIIKIETPLNGSAAYISYKEKGDAEDAVKYMDGESVDGQKVTVTKAENRPPPRGARKEPGGASETARSEQGRRDQADDGERRRQESRKQSGDDRKASSRDRDRRRRSRSRSRSRSRKKRSRSRSRRRR
eukprot:TRINITY_DN5013_c0_g1_i1.p1 TRINITY_DN5013_c0_g1~~TRINITY_DN5013_c0_g1_i1.p1  ORF type:complete len:169 (+),score=19.59 TRINITY_DN5013_c0_g1_i1:35-541(+)